MSAKDTARRPLGRRQLCRTPSKLLGALPGRASGRRGSRPALLAARLRRKHARAWAARGLPASVGKALADLTSGRRLERSEEARSRAADGPSRTAGGRWRRRRDGRVYASPRRSTAIRAGGDRTGADDDSPHRSTATHQQEGNGPLAGDATQEVAMRPQTLDPTAGERARQIGRHRGAPRRVVDVDGHRHVDPIDPRYGKLSPATREPAPRTGDPTDPRYGQSAT